MAPSSLPRGPGHGGGGGGGGSGGSGSGVDASYVRPTAPYSARAPSPPSIVIPAPLLYDVNQPMKVVPSYDNVDPAALSAADLEIITQNGKEQIAHDSACSWTYESRRAAQPVLDFLYLGPSSVARDRQWLRDNGITMLLAARDSQMAEARLMGVDRVARDLGIEAVHVDVDGPAALIRAFPRAIAAVNDHLLRVYRRQAVRGSDDDAGGAGAGAMVIDHSNFRRGRVLVFCETGNDRSASIVVAYLMAVLGQSMINACQFVCFKRFCVSLDEQHKQLLSTFEGLLVAQRSVHRHEITMRNPGGAAAAAAVASSAFPHPGAYPSGKKSKRHIEDTFMSGEDGGLGDADHNDGGSPGGEFALDRDRYVGRAPFVPFVDHAASLDAQDIGV